jgi:hypothetical protein
MKGTPMPHRPIPPHAAVAYEFCDLLDAIAETNTAGPSWAKTLASAAIASAATYFPRAAKTTLGDRLIATYKSAAATLPVKLKASPPVDDFDQLGQQIAAAARTQAMQAGSDRATIMAHLRTVLAQLSDVQPKGRTLTDQGAMTTKLVDTPYPPVGLVKKKAYDVNADRLAVALGADQVGRR